jgi:hypothetical protein
MKAIIILISLFLASINVIADDNSAQATLNAATPQNTPESTGDETSAQASALRATDDTAATDDDLAAQNDIANKKSAQAYIKSATYAEQDGNPVLARQILKQGYQDSQQISILSQWLAMDEAMYHALKSKNHALTHWKTEFEQKCLKNIAYGGKCSEYERQKELSTQENNVIAIADMENVRAVLNKYNQLKNSLTEIQTILKMLDPENVKEISHQVAALIVQVKRTRCDYLSFDVISPYLARTEQLIFISKINKPEVSSILTLVPDKSLQKLRGIEKLREAATIFAQVADMVIESQSPVREQFLSVYKKFQDVGGTKFEEFKAIEAVAEQLKLAVPCTEIWWR